MNEIQELLEKIKRDAGSLTAVEVDLISRITADSLILNAQRLSAMTLGDTQMLERIDRELAHCRAAALQLSEKALYAINSNVTTFLQGIISGVLTKILVP